MSTPDPYARADDTGRPGLLLLLLRTGAIVVAVLSLLSLWWSERTRVRDDLQLSAEATARPGERLALRAFYFSDVEAPDGPSLRSVPVTVRLLDAHDRELGRTELTPAQGDLSMEGRLSIPAQARGSYWLEARAVGAGALACRRELLVTGDAPTLVPKPREAPPLQQMALSALHSGASAAPGRHALLARVLGGACIPEQRCQVLVWLGDLRAELRVGHDASVSLERLSPEGPTRGFARVALRVHGPEAGITLEAWNDDHLSASRRLRLPVALGEALVVLPRSMFRAGEPVPLSVVLPPGRTNGILDVFDHGRWSLSRGFTQAQARALSLGPDLLGRGIVRIQAHTDRFSGEGAGARLLYVRSPGESTPHMLRAIGSALRAAGLDGAPLEEGLWELPAFATEETMVAFLLAKLEALRVPLPRAVSARPQALRRLSRGQTALRYTVGGLLALSALLVSMTLMRRGLSAQREAEAILLEASRDDAEPRNRKPASGVYYIVFFVLAVGLAFLLAALLIVAKPLWF